MAETEEGLRRLVKLLVDDQESVVLRRVEEPGRVTLELRVADDDLGKVIGRHGRTAHALRSLLAARTAGEGERYDLQILED